MSYLVTMTKGYVWRSKGGEDFKPKNNAPAVKLVVVA